MKKNVIYPFGGEEWWFGGYLHRNDGPAVTDFNGVQMWYHYGQRHRTDGPAVIFPDGREEWWINGQRINNRIRSQYPQLCPLCREPYTSSCQTVPNNDICVICWDQPPDVTLCPCGHQCLCQSCLERVKNYNSS